MIERLKDAGERPKITRGTITYDAASGEWHLADAYVECAGLSPAIAVMEAVYDAVCAQLRKGRKEEFSHALQRVLERNLPDDHQRAAAIWMQILDLPELAAAAALVRPGDIGKHERTERPAKETPEAGENPA